MEETENKANNEMSSDDVATKNVFSQGRLPIRRQLLVLAGVLTVMFAVGGTSAYLTRDRSEPLPEDTTPTYVATRSGDDDAAVLFSNVELVAESAFVLDVRAGKVMYEKEPDVEWPLASITKLMTALVAKEIVAEGAVIPITADALKQSGDNGFSAGERFSYKKLSDLVLVQSSNDGAYALASAAGALLDPISPESAFVKAMNVRARELGLSSTTFRNPTGLDVSASEAGSYGTAREVAKLMSYILANHPELLEETVIPAANIESEDGGTHEARNTNRVVGEIAKVIGSKTGYTTLAGGNLVMAFDAGLDRPIIAVVLGSSYQGRFSDMVKLVEATLNEINSQNR